MRDMPVGNDPFIETISAHSAASPRWLSIVGIGEDGVDGLGAAARALIGGADIVLQRRLFAGRRGLGRAPSTSRSTRSAAIADGKSACWPPAIHFTTGSARYWRARSTRGK